MARIVCFTDQEDLIEVTRQGLHVCGHTLSALSASSLSDNIRNAVKCIAPDLVLLEVAHTLDNPHLFFFLRSDAMTRDVPIVLISSNPQIEQHATILGAQAYLSFPCSADQICALVQSFLPRSVQEREVGTARPPMLPRPVVERRSPGRPRILSPLSHALGART